MGGDPEAPEMAFKHFSAMTVMKPGAIPDDDDLPEEDAAEAWMAVRRQENAPET